MRSVAHFAGVHSLQIPKQLQQAIADKKLVPLVGAGVSLSLRAAIDEAENSGPYEPWDMSQMITEAKRRYNAQNK